LVCGDRYNPTLIKDKPNDPETKVLLDETDEEEEIFVPPQPNKNVKGDYSKKGKSDFETEDNQSDFSDDPESNQYMQ